MLKRGGGKLKQFLTDRQIAFLLFGIIVGFGILNLPKEVAEKAGTGGWFSLIIATGISIIITFIIVYLGHVYEGKTIYEYSELLVGKFLTSIFMLFYIVYYFLIFTMITRMSSEIIKLTILFKTPVWVLSLLFLIVVYYAITRGLEGIARICELYGIIILLIAFSFHVLIFAEGQLINLRPFFVVADLPVYLKASASLIVPFLGMEFLTLVPMDRKNNKNVFKYSALMMTVIGLLYILEVESCISVIGVDDIIHYKDALIATMRRVDILYLSFLRRLDGIVLSAWIMAVFCTITIFAYGTVFLVNKIFNRVNFNLSSLVVFCISLIVSQIPDTIDQILSVIQFTGYLGIAAAGGIPILLLIITKVKKNDKKNS